MKKIETNKAPAAIGPYSQGYVSGGFVYTSGQLPLDPVSGALVGSSIEEQTEAVCKNVAAILEAAGSSLDNVIKTTCFLADMKDFAAFNGVYAKYFVNKPARSAAAVKELAKGALIEIEAIAEASNE
jgi:reactive intermediate/imine deaminase